MSTWLALTAWVAAHHAAVVEAGAVTLGIINFGLKIMPLANWVALAEKSPRIAALVRLLGGLGIQPITVLQAFIDFLRGHTSPGGAADAHAFQVSASKPLIAPKTLSPKTTVLRCLGCLTTWSVTGPSACPTCGKPGVIAGTTNDNALRDTPPDPFKKA